MTQQIKDAIGSLNHADDAQWNPDGTPRASAVTIALNIPGIEVTDAEIAEVAPTYRRMSAEELAAQAMTDHGADDEDSKVEADPRIKTGGKPGEALALPEIKPGQVAEARERKVALDAEYTDIEKQLTKLNTRRAEINKARDKLLPVLEPQSGNTFSETVQAYQKASHRTQAGRVAQIAAVNAALGGTLGAGAVAGAPSPLDASRQVRRGHGEGLKPQPQVVVKPVAEAPKVDAGKAA